MLSDLVLILGTILLVSLVAGWEIFCLTDLARADRVHFLPRWEWAVACLIQIPLGGILYLLIGRVWQRHAARWASSPDSRPPGSATSPAPSASFPARLPSPETGVSVSPFIIEIPPEIEFRFANPRS